MIFSRKHKYSIILLFIIELTICSGCINCETRTCIAEKPESIHNEDNDKILSIETSEAILNKAGTTPLHLAAAFGNDDEVKRIFLDTNNVNSKDNFGIIPIEYAFIYERYDTIMLLLTLGADINNKDIHGANLMHRIGSRLKSGRCSTLMPFENSDDTLISDIKLLEFTREIGVNINDRDNRGNTPLHKIAQDVKRPEIIQWFINAGAEVNALNNNRETPLRFAINSST